MTDYLTLNWSFLAATDYEYLTDIRPLAAPAVDDYQRRCTAGEGVGATSAQRTEDDLGREHLSVGERDANMTGPSFRGEKEDVHSIASPTARRAEKERRHEGTPGRDCSRGARSSGGVEGYQ